MNRSMSKFGRNDPCWCGSGKKYKRCHIGTKVEWPLSSGAANSVTGFTISTVSAANVSVSLSSSGPRWDQ